MNTVSTGLTTPRRSCLSGDKADDGFVELGFDVVGGLFFRRASDLSDHDDGFRLIVILEQLEAVDEVGPIHGIATDAHARRLAKLYVTELVDRLVGQRAASGDDTDAA